jgi:prepilin-type N-terminal cleavage/methylation domain-containing protein
MRRRARRGYTAIEVLISLTVFAIGAAGVIAMERAAVQGNLDARRLDTANSITRAWVERLRRDAMLWNQTTNLTQTSIVNANLGNKWVLPNGCPASGATDGTCYAFDAFGHDLSTGDAKDAVFCANIRVDRVADDLNNNPAVVRAMVRVYWPKGTASPAGGANGFCSASGLADPASGPDSAAGPSIFHFVQTVTLLSTSLVPQ